jgi:hypothetical protein
MKIRLGFVSNSSSSSFIINKQCLTRETILSIEKHIETAKKFCDEMDISYDKLDFYDGDAWTIVETETQIKGWTIMDNFDMHYFLVECLKIDPINITWNDYDGYDDDWL